MSRRGKVSGRQRAFTLIELLTALVILSLLGLMSYRGLSAVLDAREHVTQETVKWRAIDAFFTRFERDVQLAAPRPVRGSVDGALAFRGVRERTAGPLIELTRLGSADEAEPPRRIAYTLNALQEIELWLWPAPDAAPPVQPERHRLLADVMQLDIQYLAADLAWTGEWPARSERPLPLAVRVRLVLVSGEEIVRVFSLV